MARPQATKATMIRPTNIKVTNTPLSFLRKAKAMGAIKSMVTKEIGAALHSLFVKSKEAQRGVRPHDAP